MLVALYIFLAAVFAIVACCVSHKNGFDEGIEKMILAAVHTGHAEFYVDIQGQRQWRWTNPRGPAAEPEE